MVTLVHIGCPDRSGPFCLCESPPKFTPDCWVANGNIEDGRQKRRVLLCIPSQKNNIPSIAGPIVTDNGNFIIDAPFDHEIMKEPFKVNTEHTKLYLSCH